MPAKPKDKPAQEEPMSEDYEIATLQTQHGSFRVYAARKDFDNLIQGVSTPKWLTYAIVPEDEEGPRLWISVKPSEVCFLIREHQNVK